MDISASAEDFDADPYPFSARLRETGPVHEVIVSADTYESDDPGGRTRHWHAGSLMRGVTRLPVRW
ncbi:hypothetical protein J7E97_23845 [Streptomyces sp. ISL-66]|nr:hypothetical protein [Streptomyces sp. ISL-66]